MFDCFRSRSDGYWHSDLYQSYKEYMSFCRDRKAGLYNGREHEALIMDRELRGRRMWDGYVNFYNSNKRTLPIGFLSLLTRLFPIGQVEDRRKLPLSMDYDFGINKFINKKGGDVEIEGRSYQMNSVIKALENPNGIFDLAVNAGKTTIFILLSMILRKNNVLIIVDRTLLMEGILDKFKQYVNVTDIGLIKSGQLSPSNTITIAMVQTLNKNLHKLEEWYGSVNVLMIDECHHAMSKTYINLLRKSRAAGRYGFSGTIPMGKTEKMKVIQFLGPVIGTIESRELIEMDVSVRPVIRHIRCNSMCVDTYSESIDKNVIFNREKIKKMVNICRVRPNKKILIVSDLKSQGRILVDVFNSLKIPAFHFHGGIKEKDRKQLMTDFSSGKIRVLVATTVMDEGVDIEDIDIVVLAFPRKNYRQTIQRIGRGMRKSDGKEYLEVFDFFDDNDSYLVKQFSARISYYDREGFEHDFMDDFLISYSDDETNEIIYKSILTEIEYSSNGGEDEDRYIEEGLDRNQEEII